MNTSKRIMLIVGGLLIIGLAVMVVADMMGKKGRLEFEPLDGQLALVDKAREKWFSPKIDVRSSEAGQRVLCDWFYYKSLTASGADGVNDMAEQFNANLMDYVMSSSISADYYASEAAFEDLYALYNNDAAKRDEIIQKCLTMDEKLAEHIDDEVKSFRELAAREGFLDASGKIDPGKKNIVRLLHRHQWITLASRQLPRNRIEPPEEALAMLRWQIEQSSMPVQDKLKRLEVSRAIDGLNYDYDYAAGVLLYQSQRFEDACFSLKSGLSMLPPGNDFRSERYLNGIKVISQAGASACQ